MRKKGLSQSDPEPIEVRKLMIEKGIKTGAARQFRDSPAPLGLVLSEKTAEEIDILCNG